MRTPNFSVVKSQSQEPDSSELMLDFARGVTDAAVVYAGLRFFFQYPPRLSAPTAGVSTAAFNTISDNPMRVVGNISVFGAATLLHWALPSIDYDSAVLISFTFIAGGIAIKQRVDMSQLESQENKQEPKQLKK